MNDFTDTSYKAFRIGAEVINICQITFNNQVK